jgi:hypothetical protein
MRFRGVAASYRNIARHNGSIDVMSNRRRNCLCAKLNLWARVEAQPFRTFTMTNTDDSRPPPAYDARNHNMSETKKDTGPELRYCECRLRSHDDHIDIDMSQCTTVCTVQMGRSLPKPPSIHVIHLWAVSQRDRSHPHIMRTR